MAKSECGFSATAILLSSLFLSAGCDSSDKVELAKTDVKYELPKEGKKREDLPKSERPPEKGTTYGLKHDPSKGSGASTTP